MPRTGENIYKRKDGRWEGRYIKTHLPSGKTVYGYLYARTYRDLKEKMLCQEQLKNKPHLSSSPTFQTVAEEWITSRQPHLKESSIVKYRNLLNTYIFPEMGNEKILLLNYEQMDTFCHRMLTAGGKNNSGLSPKTVSDILSLIRCICPKEAISMVEDEEGFEYPQIDESKCVRCHQCIKVCPIKAARAQ